MASVAQHFEIGLMVVAPTAVAAPIPWHDVVDLSAPADLDATPGARSLATARGRNRMRPSETPRVLHPPGIAASVRTPLPSEALEDTAAPVAEPASTIPWLEPTRRHLGRGGIETRLALRINLMFGLIDLDRPTRDPS